jgi:hypothetical protein
MKYLSSYKLFESWQKRDDGSVYWKNEPKPWDYTEQMLDVLEELLLPIKDLGYKPYIQDDTENWGPHFKEPTELIIRILTYLDKNPLEITEDIIYDFDRINDYLESEGYSVFVKGVTVFNANIELSYDIFIDKYLNNGLSIKSFRNLLFVATRKENNSNEKLLVENIDYKNILEDIEDILLPIKDLGYNNIKTKLIKDYEHIIFINIIDYDNEPLLFNDDIFYEFDRLFEYLSQNELQIYTVYYKKVEPDGRIFNRGSRDALNLSYFGIDYFKKLIMNEKIAYLSFELKKLDK